MTHTLPLLEWVLSWFPPLTPEQNKAIHFYVRKGGHATAYGVLYFLWFRAFRAHLRLSPQRSFLVALGPCLLVAMTDEGLQSLIQSRSGSLWDVALDLSGSGLGALLTFAVGWPRPRAETLTGGES